MNDKPFNRENVAIAGQGLVDAKFSVAALVFAVVEMRIRNWAFSSTWGRKTAALV
jgi:hypothetical protein